MVPARHAISFIVWACGFFSDKITWSGPTYRVQNRELFPLPSASLRKETVARRVSTGIASSENIP
jgi:hypothetical protein